MCCRAAENLILCDEVLNSLGVIWDDMKVRIDSWISTHEKHKHHEIMCKFRDSNYDRKNFDLKEIRNDLMGIIASSKPWEVAVGQVIGAMMVSGKKSYPCLSDYLGIKLCETLLAISSSSKTVQINA